METVSQPLKEEVKVELYNAIEADNFDKLESLVKQNNIDINEDISIGGDQRNCLHFAAQFNRPRILEFLLKKTYQSGPEYYIGVVNNRDIKGMSLLMLASQYNAFECLELLIKYGGIKTDLVDNENRTALEIAEVNEAKFCFDKLKDLPSGILQVDEVLLKHEEVLNLEDSIFKNGKPKPCVYCDSDKGYLMFSECCGVPMHSECLKENSFVCEGCGEENIKARVDFHDVKKVFEINSPEE